MPADAIGTAFQFFAQRAATGFAIPEWLPLPDNLRYTAAVQHLDAIVYRIIGRRRDELQRQQQSRSLSSGKQVSNGMLHAVPCPVS